VAEPAPSGVAWGLRRLAWVLPLTVLVHMLGARPEIVGVFGDDLLYVGIARSLWDHGGIEVFALPGAPEVAKYPLGWPAVLAGFAALTGGLRDEAAYLWPIGFNVLAWGLMALVTVVRLVPRLGGDWRAQLAVGLLLAVNTPAMEMVPTLMSEPLFALLAVGAIVAALEGRVVAAGALVASAAMVRAVGAPLALVGVVLALLGRQFRLAGGLALGWLVQAVVMRVVRAAVTPLDEDWQAVLHYYVAYDEHMAFYTEAKGAMASRLWAVASGNAEVGLRSLGEFATALSFAGLSAKDAAGEEWVGLVMLGLVGIGAVASRASRAVGVLLGVYVTIFVFWTWPFSSRFWLPVMPLVWTLGVLGLARLGWVGRTLTLPIAAGIVLFNLIVPMARVRVRYGSEAELTAADAVFEASYARLAARVGRGDVLLGENTALGLANRLGVPAIEARALLPSELLFAQILRLPMPTGYAHAAEGPLDTLAARSGTVWVVWLPELPPPFPELFAPLQREGKLVAEDVGEGLVLWRFVEG
jgi:hypothetical protein